MDDEQLHDLAPAYSVDALDPQEQQAFEAHLADCPDCQDLVTELREAAVGLSEGLDLAPRPELREQVLRQVAAEAAAQPSRLRDVDTLRRPRSARPSPGGRRTGGQGRRPGQWLAAAAAAVVLAAGVWGATTLLGEDDLAARVVAAQDAREHRAETSEGELVVITSAAMEAAVLRLPDDLDSPEAGTTYQAWFVGADGSARSAGLISGQALDTGETLLEGEFSGAAAVALTVEPEGGSEQPTVEPFVVVPLS